MAIDNPSVVDAIGIENSTGVVLLTVADSWDWEDERKHLAALEAKLNAYLNFIENGEIWDSYPESVGRRIVIDVVGRFPIPYAGLALLDRASRGSRELHVQIRHRHQPGSEAADPMGSG